MWSGPDYSSMVLPEAVMEPANLTVTVKPPHTAVWDINTFPGMTVMKSFFFLFYATQFIFLKKIYHREMVLQRYSTSK